MTKRRAMSSSSGLRASAPTPRIAHQIDAAGEHDIEAFAPRFLADHRPAEIDCEKAGVPPGRTGHLALKLVTRAGTAEVGVHLGRGQQFDERRTVPRLGRTEHEPFGPDRLRRPGDGSQVCHAGRLASGQPTKPGKRDLLRHWIPQEQI